MIFRQLLGVLVAFVATVLAANYIMATALLSRSVTERIQAKYAIIAASLAESFVRLERATDDHIHTALQLGREILPRQAISLERLNDLQALSHMTLVETVRRDGAFEYSTIYDPAALPNYFSFSPDYAGLLDTNQVVITPVLSNLSDHLVYKYGMQALPDKQRLLVVGVEVSHLYSIFRNLIAVDTNIRGVRLLAPNGTAIAGFAPEGLQRFPDRKYVAHHAGSEEIVERADEIVIYKDLPAQQGICLECAQKGLTREGSNNFYYTLEVTFSRDEISTMVRQFRLGIIVALTGLSALFVALAYFVAQRVEARMMALARRGQQFVDKGQLDARIAPADYPGFGRWVDLINQLLASQKALDQRTAALRRQDAMAEAAVQVAHDIQSPIAALDLVQQDLDTLPEESRLLLRGAIERMRSIATRLLTKRREAKQVGDQDLPIELVAPLLESAVDEARLVHQRLGAVFSVQLPEDCARLFAQIDPSELLRVISNLLNNAAEAVAGQAQKDIRVRLDSDHDHVRITVADSGPGFSAEALRNLGHRSFSAGKEGNPTSGNGLGTLHAARTVAEMGGTVAFINGATGGAEVTLTMPRQPVPRWMCSSIDLRNVTTVVIVDDDPSIHRIWEQRLRALAPALSIAHAYNDSDCEQVLAGLTSSFVCLVDQHFVGQASTGLDMIDRLTIARCSVLVTSRWTDGQVRKRCEALGVSLLPKSLARRIHIAGIARSPGC